MGTFILAAISLLLAMFGVVIRKTYYSVPLHELKRQAKLHDPIAERLYRAAAYGESLRGLLWIFIAVTSATGVVLLSRKSPLWLSITAVILLLWATYSWLPASRVTGIGMRLTTMTTPLITWLLNYLHPLLHRPVRIISRRYSAPAHTGLFERGDVIKLIEQQQIQPDNRLSDEELEIIKRALSFGEHKVLEILTPRKQVKTVLISETVGPVLIDELHKSGQEFVLVKESPKGMVVGSLELKDLGIHSSGTVGDHMSQKVYYIHENDTLREALHAFFVTNHPLFVVVNSSEDFVGIISMQTILKQLLGHIPGDDFDQYTDVSAVAARHNRVTEVVKPDEIVEEVVE